MKIKFRPSRLKVRRQSVKWIIIHHTAEMYLNPNVRIDNPKYQMGDIFNGVLELKQGDVDYHYVVEKIREYQSKQVIEELKFKLTEYIPYSSQFKLNEFKNYLKTFKLPQVMLYDSHAVVAFKLISTGSSIKKVETCFLFGFKNPKLFIKI